MADNILISKLLSDLLEVLNTSADEQDLVSGFRSVIAGMFGIESVEIMQLYNRRTPESQMYSYISNTRKPYIDNNMSEFSEFSDIIDMKNKGYKSCALLPAMANGRIIAIISMFSTSENRFTETMLETMSYASDLMGLSIANRADSDINSRLASYFDSAFDSSVPQMLVASNGSIVKPNRSMERLFGNLRKPDASVKEALGIDQHELQRTMTKPGLFALDSQNGRLIGVVSSSKISDSLMHVTVMDSTDAETQRNLSKILESKGNLYVVNLDNRLRVSRISGNISGPAITSSMMWREIADLVRPADREDLLKSLDIRVGAVESGEMDIIDESSNPMHMKFYAARTAYGYTMLLESTTLETRMMNLEENMNDFMANTSDIMLMVDNTGYIRWCNVQVEEFLEYKKEELIGMEAKGLYVDANILDRDISYARKGTKINGTYVNLKKKGGGILPAVHFLRVRRDSESPSFIILLNELEGKRRVRDLDNELRTYNNEVRKLKNEAGLKSDFIYNISHELKTPLTNIMGFSKFLLDGEFGKLNAEQHDNLGIILDESNRLMLIITQILDATKLDAEKVKLDIHEVNIREMGNAPSIKALEESAQSKGLRFEWKAEYDVPPIMADPNKLIQVFVNLIGNAIKFTETGGITVHISMKSSRTVQCEVSDTGIGISEEDKRRLFKRFYQSQRKELARKNNEGTGLGLSITHSIIKLHRGKIRIESEHEKGTKFIFTLPVNYRPRKRRRPQ